MKVPVNTGDLTYDEKVAYNAEVMKYNTLNCPEDGIVSDRGEVRNKHGHYMAGFPHAAILNCPRRVSSKKRRDELRKQFDAGTLTDPLEFLLDMVHNADGKESRKDQIDCAKAAIPFIYAKPTVEIHTTSDAPDLTLQDVKTRMLSILDVVSIGIKEEDAVDAEFSIAGEV